MKRPCFNASCLVMKSWSPRSRRSRSTVLRLEAQKSCLFVGSSAAPNVDGIKWFIEFCWPIIRERRPNAMLYVAGSVCDALASTPASDKLLNVVETLDDLYAEASVVISPLRAGIRTIKLS